MSDSERLPTSEQGDSPPVDRCPYCEEKGQDVRAKLDTRVRINGRGIYVCPECRGTWQNAADPKSFSDKDLRI